MALHLLKLCHFLQDREGHDVDLSLPARPHGARGGLPRHERPEALVRRRGEAARDGVDPSLVYFRDRLRIPFVYQVVLQGTRDFVQDGVRCLPAATFLSALI